MHAANQQDLIYQPGITIIFDNSDCEKSPVGLENCKQITVTQQVRVVYYRIHTKLMVTQIAFP